MKKTHGPIEHLDGGGSLLGGGHGDEGEAAAPVGDLVIDYLHQYEIHHQIQTKILITQKMGENF